ncbi:MAG: succinylglutamate desuccinylase/aspartoacylase family protein [Methanobacterium sp.]|nr:succinylglutamate desuccinylase/aspartoacylase family protein [Methanobacterium sp.]
MRVLKKLINIDYSYKSQKLRILTLLSITMLFFLIIAPGTYAANNTTTNSSVYTAAAESGYTMSILDSSVGGDVLANSQISQNIPRTEFSNQIFNMAKQGSVVLKFGNGNGPIMLISAGIHGNEVEANIATMKFLEYIKDKTFNGTLYVIPFDIPKSTAANSRLYKGVDPNRNTNVPGTPGYNIVQFCLREGVQYLLEVHSGTGVGSSGLLISNSEYTMTSQERAWASYINSHSNSWTLIGIDDYAGLMRTYANKLGINSMNMEVDSVVLSTMTAVELEYTMIVAATQFLGFDGPSIPTDPNTVTLSQVASAANSFKTYFESNSRLPNYVTIGSNQISMSQFIYLLASGVVNINNGSNSVITLKTVDTATSPSGSIKAGSIYKSEFVSIAQNILSYISANGKAPNYMGTSLGNMSFEQSVFMLSKIMNYYKTNSRLPNYVSMTASSSGTTPTPTPTTVTMSQVGSAAGTVKSYYETNKALPSSVTMVSQSVSMPSLLNLLSTATLQANSGSKTAITLKTVDDSTSPSGTIKSGNIMKSEFLTLAQTITSYISTNNKAPNYMSTSLGNMSFSKLVYMYSKIMNYYKTNSRLPNYVSMA